MWHQNCHPLLLHPAEYERLQQLLAAHYIAQHPRSTWCPRPGCGRSVHVVVGGTSASTLGSLGSTSGGGGQARKGGSSNSLDNISSGDAGVQAGREEGAAVRVGSSGDGGGGGDPGRLALALAAHRGLTVQCACSTRFCFECGGPPHEPASCEQVQYGAVQYSIIQYISST